VSLRLLYRVPPLLFINFAPVPMNLFLLSIFLLIGLFVHATVQPFNGTAQNVLDGLLQVWLLLISHTSLYFTLVLQAQERADLSALNERVNELYGTQSLVLSLLLSLSSMTCFVIFGWHMVTAYPELRKVFSICKKYVPLGLDVSLSSKQIEHSDVPASVNTPQHPSGKLYDSINDSPSMPKTTPIATFSELREPLLEDSQVIMT